jgi:hypothetical protein
MRPAQQAGNDAVVVTRAMDRQRIDNAGEGDRGAEGQCRPRGREQGELPARGMPHDDEAFEVERVSAGQLAHVLDRCRGVLEDGGPATPGVAKPAVLDIPGGDPVGGEVSTEVAGMDQVVDRLPVTAVDHHDERVRAAAGRQPQIAELQRLRPVDEPHVRGRRRGLGQDVGADPGRHGVTSLGPGRG